MQAFPMQVFLMRLCKSATRTSMSSVEGAFPVLPAPPGLPEGLASRGFGAYLLRKGSDFLKVQTLQILLE